MTGLLRSTVSPSSSSMSRSTPCVDGCCGPMLRIIVWSSEGSSSAIAATSASDIRRTAPTSRISSAAPAPWRGASSWDPSDVRMAASVEAVVTASPGVLHALELHGDRTHGMVLAQREPVPVLRHQDAGQVGVARELDPIHVVHLALERLGAGVHVEQR